MERLLTVPHLAIFVLGVLIGMLVLWIANWEIHKDHRNLDEYEA